MRAQLNLQDLFLNQVRKENIPVTIYLGNQVQLRGHVRGFDAFTVVLDSVGKHSQLVYKHSIASIVPSRPVPGFLPESPREGTAHDRDTHSHRMPAGQEAESDSAETE